MNSTDLGSHVFYVLALKGHLYYPHTFCCWQRSKRGKTLRRIESHLNPSRHTTSETRYYNVILTFKRRFNVHTTLFLTFLTSVPAGIQCGFSNCREPYFLSLRSCPYDMYHNLLEGYSCELATHSRGNHNYKTVAGVWLPN